MEPGISSFASEPSKAGASLAPLIEAARKTLLGLGVPEASLGEMPVFLQATAGVRLLPAAQREAVIGSVRAFLSDDDKCPFLFAQPSWARVVSGEEEGVNGWITLNHALGALSGAMARRPRAAGLDTSRRWGRSTWAGEAPR